MPWVDPQQNSEYIQPRSVGPVMLTTPLFATNNGPPATIAASGAWDSGILTGDGYKALSAGVTSTQAGAITITRYIDQAGTVQQGAAASTTLVASTAAVVNVTDGLPFASFRIRVTNTGGSTATISGFAALMAAA
jgi:hypothetical protein